MSVKSKKSSPKKKLPIDRPFAPAILAEAELLAPQFSLVLQPEPEGGVGATVLEMPNVYGFGDTVNDCVRETRELLVTMLAYMLETGEAIPSPGAESKRTEQVNVRLTALEKLRLEDESRRAGFRGLSDYIRNRALSAAANRPSPRKPRRAG